jgi:hypothetical protein
MRPNRQEQTLSTSSNLNSASSTPLSTSVSSSAYTNEAFRSGSSLISSTASFDSAGNTLTTARQISVGSTATNFSDWVGTTDTNDYYRFSVTQNTNLNLTLSGLSGDADLTLLDSNGNTITSSNNFGTANDSINRQLQQGNYFIRVFPMFGVNTNYNLAVAATPVTPSLPDLALNSLSTARQISVGSTATNFSDWVGTTDTNDYYRFSVTQNTNLNLTLSGLSGNADLSLLDSNGNTITSSNNFGTANDFINRQLQQGNYFIRVFPMSGVNTNYNLSVAATPVNIAPSLLNFSISNPNLSNTDTLNLIGGSVSDVNGVADLSRIDFQLFRDGRLVADVLDVNVFTANPSDSRSANFNYSLSLRGLNLTNGNYSLRAVAYDKAGLGSNVVDRGFQVTQPNIAPNLLKFNLNSTNLKTTDTISINSGSVYDANGISDISKVDFRIFKDARLVADIADVSSFTTNTTDNRLASFNYSQSLNALNLAAGNYSLWAVAYDKAGAASNIVEQLFTIQVPVINDWFSLNLKDKEITTLARSLANDGNLSRNDMLSIFRNAQDFSTIDTNEINDLRTLVNNASRFTMQDNVRWLSGKVAQNAFVNMSAAQFESNLVGRWFLGTVAPTAQFNDDIQGTTYNFTYKELKGSLFGSSGQARIGDINQGSFGDCAFLAALGATFGRQSSDAGNTSSSIINSMIIDNGDNTYTMRFYSNNVAEYATVDRRVATYNGSIFGASANGSQNPDNPNNIMWVPLLERAYAQWHEWRGETVGYDRIGNGDYLAPPLEYITGRKATDYSASNISFSTIESALKNAQAVTTARISNSTNLIVGGHAYSVTNTYVNSYGQQRVVMRNPWGVDNDSWQNKSGADDGFIDLSFDEFRRSMDYGVTIV